MARNTISLGDFVDDFLFEIQEDDTYLKYANRSRICNMALKAIREFQVDIGGTLKSLRLTIDTDTNSVDFPEDFVDYSKIGILDSQCNVRTLGRNDKLNISSDLLLDSNGNKLLDSDGIELTTETPCDPQSQSQTFYEDFLSGSLYYNYYRNGSVGQLYGAPTGQNRLGEYRIDYENSRIEFASVIKSEIILEYIADESMKSNPLIPVKLVEALKQYTYWKMICFKSNVPIGEKERARREYFNEKRLAKQRMKSAKLYELVQAARTGSKQAPKF